MSDKFNSAKNNRPKKNQKGKGKYTLITFFQSLYFTIINFATNDLISYASSCAFGFLFSFIPIVMMILVILIRVLHASPNTVGAIISSLSFMNDYFNVEDFVNSLLNIKSISNFEVIIAFAIIWMARRFFASTMSGLNHIFKTKRKNNQILLGQVVILAGETILVILVSIIIFAVILFNTAKRFTFVSDAFLLLPDFFQKLTLHLVNIMPYAVIFILITLAYKAGSRTKIKISRCMISAVLCTGAFYGFQQLMGLFINVNNYNMIYGVLSSILVMLMEVFFFFMIFYFFAQWLFVYKFFDSLLLGELYLLPQHNEISFINAFRRMLFIRPDYLLGKRTNVISLKKGDVIFEANQEGSDCYYVVNGTIELITKNHIDYMEQGSIFGEDACLINGYYHEKAIAGTEARLIRIPEKDFSAVLEQNTRVSSKAISKISKYYTYLQTE